ncbi:MAG: DUF1800 domain-containing protein [Crocinitomicaceae bacterium]
MENRKFIHLYNCFGFGLTGKQIKKLSGISFAEKLKKEKVEEIKLDLSEFEGVDFRSLPEKERKEFFKKLREKIKDLNLMWLDKMIHSENIIQEKMNLFWHHHFACSIENPLYGQQFTNIIRKNATGNFRDLVLEVSKSAAMIDFLHAKQNEKSHPNEDFARELCELYTLGRDNEYTEKDVQEIARAFTGWRHKMLGEFIVHPKKHDEGNKTIFGKTGNFNGEEVIDLILEKKACAEFICKNIYEYFVHPKVNEKHVKELTDVFYTSKYDIQKLIIHIAESNWFYEEQNILAKIKSPIEFIVGLSRQFKIENENPKSWLLYQKLFDQILYRPPNVKGWKVDQEWIDSNSLPLRLRLPSIILTNAQLDLAAKPNYDENPLDGMKENKFSQKLGFTYDWEYFFDQNQGMDFKDLFFNGKLSPQMKAFIDKHHFETKYEEVIQLISLPEFQLI